ncbi:MAG TPA: hypothetical protein VF789_29755 [Thermoanaerobaculia bacterium]
MTRDEYERHLRRLEEQLRLGIEILQASYRHQVGAVELIWRMTNGEGTPLPSLQAETAAVPQPQAAVPPPAAPAGPSRRGAWDLYRDIREALPRVPEVFDASHLRKALGYEPNRSSLHRALRELVDEGFLTLRSPGRGKRSTSYQQTDLDPSLED